MSRRVPGRGHRRKLSTDQVAEIIRLREKGKTIRFIEARVPGAKQSAIMYHCLRAGLDPFNGRKDNTNQRGAFTGAEDARIDELGRQGATVSAIARDLKRPRTSILIRSMLLAVRQEQVLGQ